MHTAYTGLYLTVWAVSHGVGCLCGGGQGAVGSTGNYALRKLATERVQRHRHALHSLYFVCIWSVCIERLQH